MNTCPCGKFDPESNKNDCFCLPGQIYKYQQKISGPILERIDLICEIKKVKIKNVEADFDGQIIELNKLKEKIAKARQVQVFRSQKGVLNSQIKSASALEMGRIKEEVAEMSEKICDKYNFSYREKLQMFKVARTIADLDEEKEIEIRHLLESAQFRRYNLGVRKI